MNQFVIIAFFLFVVCSSYAELSPGELNHYCVTVEDCKRFGYMCGANRTCQCVKFYFPDVKREKCIGGVDQRCKYDEHCIEGAFCENQKQCKCKEEFVASLDGSECYSSSKTNIPSFVTFTIVLLITFTYFRTSTFFYNVVY